MLLRAGLIRDGNSNPTGWNATNITTETSTLVKTGAGFLGGILFNKPLAAGVVTIYDGTTSSGTKLATITFPATLLSDVTFWGIGGPSGIAVTNGVYVVTSGAVQDITVLWV